MRLLTRRSKITALSQIKILSTMRDGSWQSIGSISRTCGVSAKQVERVLLKHEDWFKRDIYTDFHKRLKKGLNPPQHIYTLSYSGNKLINEEL